MSKAIRLLGALLIGLIIYSNVSYASNWKWVFSSDTSGYYIDTSSLICEPTYYAEIGYGVGYVCFWDMVKFEDENYRQQQENELQRYYPGVDFSNFYYAIAKEEFLYQRNSIYNRILTTNFYRKDNTLITSDRIKGRWNEVPPGTVGEKMYYKALELGNYVNKRR